MSIKSIIVGMSLVLLIGCNGSKKDELPFEADQNAQQVPSSQNAGNQSSTNSADEGTNPVAGGDATDGDEPVTLVTGDGETTTTFTFEDFRNTTVHEGGGTLTSTTVSTKPVDFSNFISTGNINGEWQSECLNETITENDVETYATSQHFVITASEDTATLRLIGYLSKDCQGEGNSVEFSGSFEGTIQQNAEIGQVYRMTSLEGVPGIGGDYLFSPDGNSMVRVSGPVYLGYSRIN